VIPRSAGARRTRRPLSEPPELELEPDSPPPPPPALVPPTALVSLASLALVALPSPPELCGIGCDSGGVFFDPTSSSGLGTFSDSPSTFFRAFSIMLFFDISSGDFSFRLAGWDEKSRICNRIPARVYVLGKGVGGYDRHEERNCLLQSLHMVW
jgi:hypothetical protein